MEISDSIWPISERTTDASKTAARSGKRVDSDKQEDEVAIVQFFTFPRHIPSLTIKYPRSVHSKRRKHFLGSLVLFQRQNNYADV